MGNTVIQVERETAANWTSNNPTLAAGEMGLETDTNKFKFGDGSTAWNSLPYVGAGASFKYGLYTLSTAQTSNLSTGNHVEFNTTQGSLGGLSTGTGQENGIITLTGNKTYKLTSSCCTFYSASSGNSTFQLYDRTNSTVFGIKTVTIPTTYSASHTSSQHDIIAIISPPSNIDIDLRIITSSNLIQIYSGHSWLLIEEYGGY